MSCTACCLATFACPNSSPQSIKQIADPGAVFAPYVALSFIQTGSGEPTFVPADATPDMTVGNMSSPSINNHAVIKSLQYSAQSPNGHMEATVEIYDEEGSEFSVFMDNLNSTIEAQKNYNIALDFGWIISSCQGGGAIPKRRFASTVGSGPLFFMPIDITASYENGKIKFTIKMQDLIQRMGENRVNKVEGTDDNKKTLVQAIKDLCSQNQPAITNVQFLRMSGGVAIPFLERGGKLGNSASALTPEGPENSWKTNNEDVPTVIRRWLNGIVTDNGKGLVLGWNPAVQQPTLVIWEDGGPDCNTTNQCLNSIGTYIVNGGDCSPVISFNPSVKWTFLPNNGNNIDAAGGSTKDQNDNDGGNVPDPNDLRSCRQPVPGKTRTAPPAGGQVLDVTEESDLLWMPPGISLEARKAARKAQEKAIRSSELPYAIPIECDLKIQGDPLYASPILWTWQQVSLIVINPFYISGKCPSSTWLAQPACNSVFTSREWTVKQVSHEIREGSYTTTLRLTLPIQPTGQGIC